MISPVGFPPQLCIVLRRRFTNDSTAAVQRLCRSTTNGSAVRATAAAIDANTARMQILHRVHLRAVAALHRSVLAASCALPIGPGGTRRVLSGVWYRESTPCSTEWRHGGCQPPAANSFHLPSTKGVIVLSWSITFLIIALIAGVLGFFGVAGLAATIAKILFLVFLVLFVVSLLSG